MRLAYLERFAASGGASALTLGVLRSLGYALLAVTAVAIAVLAIRWRRRGMGTDQLARWLVGSTTSGSFWRQPQISPLLRAAVDGQPTGPTTPHEYLRAICDATDNLTGAARAHGCDAVASARTLLAGIELLDAELVALRRDADPIDVMRVEDRLAMLGRTSLQDDQDREQMRILLSGQLEVFARLTAWQEQVVTERAELVDRLRSLWAAVRQLGSDDATPTVRASSAESLRELHLAIERDVQERRLAATRTVVDHPRPTRGQGRPGDSPDKLERA